MFKIGEFSKLTQVSVRMLRYYDENGLLKPATVDADTGYRMYAVDQIPRLNKIIYLRDSGFSVAEILEALEYSDTQKTLAQLDQKLNVIKQNIEDEKEKLNKIRIAKQQLSDGKQTIHYNTSIKSIPGYQVISLRRILPDYYHEGELWKELSTYLKQYQIRTNEETFSIYHDMDYREQDVDVELCVQVDKEYDDIFPCVYRYVEPVEFMACTMVYGEFSNIAKAYQTFASWLEKNDQYTMAGSSRQIVHRGPWNEENPDAYLTEIQIPLIRNK
ncbi:MULTISPECIES: MerR family transcriptional regulator [unclassified Breznakia]|uniref:MerR family transcriptional regulator n=1 Tax=unclassified Breznakia TaxID=2623764 RepID=UPI002475E99F|nr:MULTISPECIES: MerR family transcriptional regulator [unclassified Breznakia]MDH6366411.1 DNA-binding transcriptional MerR regulator [Breznakia sp. PH1-1]MDH6403504.1 DNA-binding transcriptional MerR regulator [Breznakia sp. PF1-11]MDH6411213.1 DNA-binding transcriptional MerR regulator [Breznakia sp. PFB1-11]MDH6413524.1 DNA-binding transcriptional MerR regulator [Breznakia sp. PFB1-14]MDH6415758.1 DNA-binding transcriptional MerR regulator [Breznakia sp. PFB1-4]